MAVTRTLFAYRIELWTADGESIVEHLAGVENYQIALATYRAASGQGERVIEDSRRKRNASWSNKGSREGGR